MANLKDFCETGMLGPLQVGLDKTMVNYLLGDPDSWTEGRSRVGAPEWRKDSLILGFDHLVLTSIGIDTTRPISIPNACGNRVAFQLLSKSADEMVHILTAQSIEHHWQESDLVTRFVRFMFKDSQLCRIETTTPVQSST